MFSNSDRTKSKSKTQIHQNRKVRSKPKPEKSLIFLSYSPCVGGISTHEAIHISALEGTRKILLVGENTEHTLARISTHFSPKTHAIPLLVWSSPAMANIKLLKIIIAENTGKIVVNNPALLVKMSFALAAARIIGVEVIIFLHSEIFRTKKRLFFVELMCSALMVIATKIVYVSEFTKTTWTKKYPWMRHYTSLVFHNLVRRCAGQKKPLQDGKNLQIGFVGRLEHEKNPIAFCEIAHLAKLRRLPLDFVVYGCGSQLNSVLKYANCVRFAGVKSEIEIFESVDILLMTSRTENCPYVVLEAKVRGVPCVANNIGGVSEILTNKFDGILLVNPKTEDYIEAIGVIAADYNSFRDNCLNVAERYIVDQKSGDLDLLYNLYPTGKCLAIRCDKD